MCLALNINTFPEAATALAAPAVIGKPVFLAAVTSKPIAFTNLTSGPDGRVSTSQTGPPMTESAPPSEIPKALVSVCANIIK